MATGSIVESFIGGQLLGVVPTAVLLPLLALILIPSALKVRRHRYVAHFGGTDQLLFRKRLKLDSVQNQASVIYGLI
jgi:hypothetical protein